MNKYLKICLYCSVAVFFSITLSSCDYNGGSSGSANSDSKTTTTTPSAPAQSQPITTPKSTPTYSSPTFHGNTCTGDCSGHEAGYDWAEEKGITDPDDCGGNSTSFIEGCESYAQEQGDSSSYDDSEDYDY